MKKKTLAETLNDKLGQVPLKRRKTYIIIFCVSVFFVAISKTTITISSKKGSSNQEWLDSTNRKDIEQLNNNLKTAEMKLKETSDSLQSLMSTIDSFNLQLEENEEKK
ncbi:MAG: hypothetical protein J5767_08575 [Paludibacteraceae bacterium]|nr:hypothetical protein [Paludibacteraceae bacterium]